LADFQEIGKNFNKKIFFFFEKTYYIFQKCCEEKRAKKKSKKSDINYYFWTILRHFFKEQFPKITPEISTQIKKCPGMGI